MSKDERKPREPTPLRSFFTRPPPLPPPVKAAPEPPEQAEPSVQSGPPAKPAVPAPLVPLVERAIEAAVAAAPPKYSGLARAAADLAESALKGTPPTRAPVELGDDAHVTRERWEDELPESLVICCSDGRYHAHFEEYVRTHLSERPDMIALPGEPATLDGWGSSFDHERVLELSLRLMVESHRLRAIWLIAHAECAFYAHKHPGLSGEARLERQNADLRTARKRLLERWPALAVHCVFATPRDGHVAFEPVR
ncbi:MAG: hypothetical protein FJ299_13065 [Planctomycetes bacterium]|nr:hypothetical protein [Planctomycetota bacterium]